MLWKSAQPPGFLRLSLGRLVKGSPAELQGFLKTLEVGFTSAATGLDHVRLKSNAYLSGYEPWQLLLAGVFLAYVLNKIVRVCSSARRAWTDKGWKQVISGFVLDLPLLRGVVARQQQAAISKLRQSMQKSGKGGPPDGILTLPRQGISAAQIKQRLTLRTAQDVAFGDGDSHVSGTVYIKGASHQLLLTEVYKKFQLTNPIHADVFPSVRKMEAEVVAMTASFLGGGPTGDPGVCGCMTSGGTESILTAVKATRDYMASHRGIFAPEMVIGVSAHPAFVKAAEYFKIRLVRVDVGADFRVSGAAAARAVGRNTVLVVASSPGFPHGVMDHVEDIAKVCTRRGVPLHVDCCLGGFVLPFARELGHPIPPFDFSVNGVTSMSVDTHKFGQAHKGTSVVLYRSPAIRQFQYTAVESWTGGLYISPGFAGSRSGALIATAWASMVHMGREGYLAATSALLDLSTRFIKGIKKIEGLEVLGAPDMCVIAFKSTRRDVNIYRVNDLMTARGWHLNALQRPAALHVCFTPAHVPGIVDEMLRDLEECVAGVLAHPDGSGGDDGESMAPMYGMAATVPDRRIVSNFLVAFQDILLEPQ